MVCVSLKSLLIDDILIGMFFFRAFTLFSEELVVTRKTNGHMLILLTLEQKTDSCDHKSFIFLLFQHKS